MNKPDEWEDEETILGKCAGGCEMDNEQLAKLYGELTDVCGFQPYRPRLVSVDGKIVGNCTVSVGPDDVNWYRHRVGVGFDGKIKVGGGSVGWHEPGWQWKHKIVE